MGAEQDLRLLSGTEMLVEMLLAQARSDRLAGKRTMGFVSGYRGSPLGALDTTMDKRKLSLSKAGIKFSPGINEELAATAVMGTQKVETNPTKTVDGVFALWYGKGPGLDRAGDALKHGNIYGSSPTGGVLVVVGDDHACVSSAMSQQSDLTMVAWSMPVLHPFSVDDYVEVGLWGWQASRATGLWIGFKAISSVVEGAVTWKSFEAPEPLKEVEVDPGPDGLHWRWPDPPGQQLERRLSYKLAALQKFGAVNPIDVLRLPPGQSKGLIVGVGKAFGDLLECLHLLGVSSEDLMQAGVGLAGVRLVYPISQRLIAAAKGSQNVLVIEEKAAVVEHQLKTALYSTRSSKTEIWGKFTPEGNEYVSAVTELSGAQISVNVADWLASVGFEVPMSKTRFPITKANTSQILADRAPYFCAGCPHSTSTKVPEGSRAQAGIGCHVMALSMDRATTSTVQMGGEGADWIGQAPFVGEQHIFQNLGDGTYFHSGHLAIRQAVAARCNITYKILWNSVVAMTGGQALDGPLSLSQAVRLVVAEGVAHVAIVNEDGKTLSRYGKIPPGVRLFPRSKLQDVQVLLRAIGGVTVLFYDQECATEKRRKLKRNHSKRPATRVLINSEVCEGCGDCQAVSNCVAIVRTATELGVKRAVDQDTCNYDLSCVQGFCPSFVTVETDNFNTPLLAQTLNSGKTRTEASSPKDPVRITKPYNLLFVGIGGTGVVTASQFLAAAAKADGYFVRILNYTGFAQKGGTVVAHVRFAPNETDLHVAAVDDGEADLIIAADLLASGNTQVTRTMNPARTSFIYSTEVAQSGKMIRGSDGLALPEHQVEYFRNNSAQFLGIDAPKYADGLVGDRQQTNIILLGYAFEAASIPLSVAAMKTALTNAKINLDLFEIFQKGRGIASTVCIQEQLPQNSATPHSNLSLDELISEFGRRLELYQNRQYRDSYFALITTVRMAAEKVGASCLTESAARSLYKLMAYKDEFEVARLLSSDAFRRSVSEKYGDGFRATYHLFPPILERLPGHRGQHIKYRFGSWIIPILKVISASKSLRNTILNPFQFDSVRRDELNIKREYQEFLHILPNIINEDNVSICHKILELPQVIKGFGHIRARTQTEYENARGLLLLQLKRISTNLSVINGAIFDQLEIKERRK